jgi:hypothetical protein
MTTKDEIGRTCSMYGEKRYVYRILVGKLEEKRPHWRPTHRWEDNIRMDHRKI